MRECARPGCGQPLVRHVGERSDHWAARTYCSRACKHALIRARYNGMERPDAERKVCLQCEAVFVKPYDENRTRWANRVACSRKCARALQSKGKGKAVIKLAAPAAMGRPPIPQVLRPCVSCGCIIPKPESLTWARYRAKTTCGSEHCRNHQASRPKTGGPAEIVADVATLMRPSPKQRAAWLQASEAERRLFAPEIRAAMGAM